jgi:protein arginine N-methyltransferase 3
MAHNDVDFTSSFVLHTKAFTLHESAEEGKGCNGKTDERTWCYGLVIWFDTHFTDRFCKENPVILTTSPYAPKTHWSQTLLTFQDPICLSSTRKYGEHTQQADSAAGTVDSPAEYLKGRISIARSSRHRSIDISLETIVVGAAGVSRQLPVQIFDM